MYQPQLQKVRLSGPSHPSQLTGTEKQLKPPKLSLSFRMVFSWWKVEANYDHELRTKALETGTRIGKGTLYKAVDGEEVLVEQQHPDVGRVPRRHQPRREQPSAGWVGAADTGSAAWWVSCCWYPIPGGGADEGLGANCKGSRLG
jgi:hypothetical protein